MENEFEIRLRQQIDEIVRTRFDLLEKEITRLHEEVNSTFATLRKSLKADAGAAQSSEMVAQLAAEVKGMVGQASADSARLGTNLALLRDSVLELSGQKTQADVLNTLVTRASNFAPRLVLFVIKGENAMGWSAQGFEDGVGNNAIRGVSISLQSDTVLKAAVSSQQTFYGLPDQQSANQQILNRLGSMIPQRVLALPLMVRSKPAAIIYADSGDRGQEAINVEAIELLVCSTGFVVELTSLRSRLGEPAPRPAAQPAVAPQPAIVATPVVKPVAPPVQAPVPAPVAMPVQPPPSAPVIAPVAETSPQPGLDAQAARYTHPVSQRQTAPAGTAIAQPPIVPPPQAATPPSIWGQPQPVPPPAAPVVPPTPVFGPAAPVAVKPPVGDEEKLHSDARRFARLLVSEIKLYNEERVVEGRKNNDLYERLKEDIDRSRQMYDKRVSPSVAAKFDYFYDELVSLLAEGNPARLGHGYPGPTVRV